LTVATGGYFPDVQVTALFLETRVIPDPGAPPRDRKAQYLKLINTKRSLMLPCQGPVHSEQRPSVLLQESGSNFLLL
jgi:hypothetical protein